jgi:hypothetical protein
MTDLKIHPLAKAMPCLRPKGLEIGRLRFYPFRDSAFTYATVATGPTDALLYAASVLPWRYTKPDWPTPAIHEHARQGMVDEAQRLGEAARERRQAEDRARGAVQSVPKGEVREVIESAWAKWKAKGITPRLSEDSQVPPGFLEAFQPGESPAEFSARCGKFGVVAIHCSATHDGALRVVAVGPWDMPARPKAPEPAAVAAQEVPGPGDRFTSPAELLRLGERPLITADEGERSGWGTYDGD